MADAKQLAKAYLAQANVLQLATSANDEPWVCTVHFYADDDFNFYWVSRTDRHHSQQIAANPNASITLVVHENTPEEDYVISVSASGRAEVLSDADGQAVAGAYNAKHHKPPNMLPDPANPDNPQKFYRLRPQKITLFDTKDFSSSPKQEFTPNAQ